jgi:putative sigma-54 modulation protein
MKLIITSKNLNASDHLRDTIESKFAKLNKYFSRDIETHIILSLEKNRQRIEATINANGTIFRAENTSNDIYGGIDAVADKLAGQMSKYKSKLIKKHKDAKGIAFDDLPDIPEAEDSEPRIERRKKFELLPMTPEEAIIQMELLGHQFFVFLNMETNSIGVVYSRNEGGYGLLETEI